MRHRTARFSNSAQHWVWCVALLMTLGIGCGSKSQGVVEESQDQRAVAQAALPEGLSDAEAAAWILEKVDEAAGTDALAKVESRRTEAVIVMGGQGITIRSETFQLGSDQVYSRQEMAGLGTIEMGYDGEVGWSRDPMTGLRQREGTELEEVKRMTLAYERSFDFAYREKRLLRVDLVDGRPCYELEMIPRVGEPEKHCVDAETFLPVRLDQTSEGVQGRAQVRSWITSYMEVDGMQVPKEIRAKVGPIELVTQVVAVEHGVVVDPEIFAFPGEAN